MDVDSPVACAGPRTEVATTLRVALWTSTRDSLSALARQLDRIAIVGEASTLAGALQIASTTEPDAMFVSCNELALDIAAFTAVAAAPRPLMVLIGETAADALAAFEARALDFVPRPIDGARLQRAVDRAREWIEQTRLQRLLVGVAAGLEPTPSPETMAEPLLRLRVKGHIVVVRPSDIELIEACGNYVRVVTPASQYLHQGTMKQCLTALHPYGFVRAHRRVIVNSRLVRGSAPGGQLLLQSGRLVRCGRLYRHLLHSRVRGVVRRGAIA